MPVIFSNGRLEEWGYHGSRLPVLTLVMFSYSMLVCRINVSGGLTLLIC